MSKTEVDAEVASVLALVTLSGKRYESTAALSLEDEVMNLLQDNFGR